MHLQARGRALRALSCDALLSRSCRSSRGCAAVPCRNANTQPLKKLVPTYWPIGWNQRPNLRSTSSILSHTHLTLQLSHKQIPPFHVIPVLWKAKPWSTALFRLAGSGCLGHVRPARRNCLASLRVRSRFLWSRGKGPTQESQLGASERLRSWKIRLFLTEDSSMTPTACNQGAQSTKSGQPFDARS